MKVHKSDTALVVIDPQNVLSEKGVSWPLVGASVKENNTVENLARLFQAAKEQGFGVFISPHYLYPFDQDWQFAGAVEKSRVLGARYREIAELHGVGFVDAGQFISCSDLDGIHFEADQHAILGHAMAEAVRIMLG